MTLKLFQLGKFKLKIETHQSKYVDGKIVTW